MAISQSKYVDITSGQGGQAVAAYKEMIGRFLSNSPKLAAKTVKEFTSADNVGLFFGYQSEEYYTAATYFNYTNPYMNKPSKISFYRVTINGLSAFLYGTQSPAPLAQLQTVTDGSFSFSLGGVSADITGLNFSTANDYATVAQSIQSAIRGAQSVSSWQNATVEYNALDNVFVIMSGDIVDSEVIMPLSAPQSGTDISSMLGLSQGQNPVISYGVAEQSAAQMLNEMANISNNFATFADLTDTVSKTDMAEFASLSNVAFMASLPVTADNAAQTQRETNLFSGTALVLNKFENERPEIIPMAIAASIDYDRLNGVVSFDFKQFAGITPSVTNDADYELYNGLKINFYGATQQAGQPIAFFQHGYLQGSVADMGVYVNEIWLKDHISTDFINYMISVPAWSASTKGKAAGDAIVMQNVELAKRNGTILQGKPLTNNQKAYILSLTGDPEAWRKVQEEGYYATGEIVNETADNGTEQFIYKYSLIYCKGDIIRKVEGADILI